MDRSREALIFNVQRFSVHDGPGIRTTVFFKGCPLACRWCQNPESLRRHPEIAFYPDRCRATHACAPACPRDAIRLDTPDRIDRDRCDGCGDCVDRCAFGALQHVGRVVTLDALLAEVLRDRPFYASSGGGVTLSGGEATLQLPFVRAFTEACRAAGVSVGLQTCGAFRWDTFAPALAGFDFIHYDLKIIDPARHKAETGADNATIVENARQLVAAGAPVVFRLPLVPGYTDDDDNLAALAALLHELDTPRLELLPYHALGEVKRARLEITTAPVEPIDRARTTRSMTRAVEHLRARGIDAHAAA